MPVHPNAMLLAPLVGLLLGLAAASVDPRPWKKRGPCAFSLAPMGEVAALFCGIFMAMQVPLAVLGWMPAWLAGLGMALSSLLVVLNALRLARQPQAVKAA